MESVGSDTEDKSVQDCISKSVAKTLWPSDGVLRDLFHPLELTERNRLCQPDQLRPSYINSLSLGYMTKTGDWGEYTVREREWKRKTALSLHWLLWKLDKIVNWWKWNIVSSHVWPLANPQTLFLWRCGASKNVKWQTSSKYLIHVQRPDWNLEAGSRHSFSTLLAGSIVAVWQQIRKWAWILFIIWQNTRKWAWRIIYLFV